MRQFIRIARQSAAVILVVTALSFSCLMTVEAYQARFTGIVTEVFYDLTHFTLFSFWSEDMGLGEIEFGCLPDGMHEVECSSPSENAVLANITLLLPETAVEVFFQALSVPVQQARKAGHLFAGLPEIDGLQVHQGHKFPKPDSFSETP